LDLLRLLYLSMTVHPASRRSVHPGSTPINPLVGGSNCSHCRQANLRTKIVLETGFRLIRARFGISPSELPVMKPGDLSVYLSFLQQYGHPRSHVVFPFCQGRPDREGFLTRKRLGRMERWELALSIASLKRSLPNSCSVHSESPLDAWRATRFSIPPPPPQSYAHFARMVAYELFPPGWDRTYIDRVNGFVANASSRGPGASRGDLAWAGSRELFHLSEVPTPGKKRAITIPSSDADVLGPLHHTLYDALRRTSWLLVGPPTEGRISSFMGNRPWCTSVDLVNATDGLDLSISRIFLEVANATAFHVPIEIMEFGLSSLNAMVDSKMIQHGQMMGIYLSFPLLCCHSYTAARWASRGDNTATYLVNGDDTVISGQGPFSARSYPPGYELNDKKTVRSETVVELNSTVFLKKRGSWREVRNLRRGGFDPSTFTGMMSGSSACAWAGRPWASAFVRSRIGKGWRFLPSLLGLLQTGSHPAFARERYLRRDLGLLPSALPTLPTEVSEVLLMCVGTPAPDEVAALIGHQWQYGREKGKRDKDIVISIGQYRKSLTYRCQNRRALFTLARRRGFGTCESYLREGSPRSGKNRPVYFVPEKYMSWKEQIGIIESSKWKL